ncbi:LIC12162 family transferase [Selenomonas noxia]
MSTGSNIRDKEIFLPLSTNKKLWNLDADMIFLNQIYFEQIDEAEKVRLQYIFFNAPLPVKDQSFQDTIKEIAANIGQFVNIYSHIHEDREYWEKIFFRWLLYVVYDVQVKIVQFQELKKKYPDRIFYTYAPKTIIEQEFFESGTHALWRDDYHLWLYTYLAKKYFNIRVDAVDLEEAVVGEVRGAKRDKSFLQSVCCKIKKIFIESPLRTMKRAISYYYRIFCHNKSEVLYYGLDVSVDTTINWIARSFGTIQPLYYPSRQIDAPRSSELREELTSALRGLEIISPIVADVIGRTLPKLYLEEYKYHHVSSLSFLRAHKRLKLIFSTTGILSPCKETIFSFLAQRRRVKIIGLQHGGDYEIVDGIFDQEEYLDDSFYFWAREEVCPRSYRCKIFSGPSYKFHYYQDMQLSDQYILFIGTALLMYPRYDEYRGEDIYKIRYMSRQIEFFSALEEKTRDDLYVREYYVDSGWHIVSQMEKTFPMLRFSGREKTASNYGAVDIVDRNSSFAETLARCRLMICDHLSTTWREALYLDKPFIMLLDREVCSFREEALESLRLMESVGIIIYDCKEAASLLNRIREDVSGWWNEPERQEVIKKIRRNYLIEVDDIDDWWMHELLHQARS